uniref:histone acetyltransferase n=1 Tax=Panagrellus redivivus TaxID=6233 RepID=A0A7E4W0D6_PANRE
MSPKSVARKARNGRKTPNPPEVQEQLRYLTPEQIRQLPSNCDLPKCKEYRILMDHMDNCKHGDHCKVKGCAFVNQYFAHFHQCIDDECKVCSLVRAEFGSAELTYGPTPFSKTWQETVPDFVRHEFAFKVFSIILCLDSPAYEPPPLPKDLHDSVLHDLVDAEETYFKTSGSKKEYGFFTASHYYKYRLMRNRAFSFALRERCHGMHKRTVALRHSMLRVWYLIDGHKDSHWFYVPVPDDLNVAPHYYKIISDPMDLTTLRRNIDNGKYECLRAFFNDVWLIFENARHYNTDESDVHIATFEMLKHLGPLANKMLTSMGYCCGEHRTYPPSIILCHSAKGCAIKPREYYWFYDEPCFHPVTGKPTMPRRYRFCDTCYTHAVKSGDRLIAGSDLAVPYGGTPTELDPKKFVMINNVRPRREPMVQCLSCNKLSHSVCVSHIKPMFPGGFLCPPCTRKITGMDYKITKMSNRLPHCNISKYIETRVNDFIKEELDKDPKADFEKSRIAIRMLCNSVHEVEVKPRIRSQYPSLPDKIPYRSKAIFAFQMVNGREICFFGMHVQEYGDVPGPNRHRVYISYLDSVHYFEPRNLRTRVYYMMILSYLENCTERGFRTAHIWACPPSTGDDYIFNGHPSEQKMPKTKQLQDWYQKMAAFGMERKLIVSYKHLSEYVVEHGIRTMAEMPYFEGDFWVNHMEEIIEECEKREIKQQQQLAKDLERLEKQSTPVADLFPMVNPLSPYRKNSKSRPAASSASTAKRRCLSHRQQTLQEIIEERFSAAVKKNRDNFFCFTLIPEDEPNKVQTVPFMDTDPLLPSEFMDGRDAFLAKCRENSWVFSTPRHTHYSTLQMCHTLMNQAPLVVHYTCNGCGKDPAWHCLTCDDFDVCNTCPQTHPHPLEMLATLNDLEEVAARRRERDHFMFLGKQALPHALACRNTSDCEFPLCSTAKKMQSHWMSCAIKLKDCISCRLYCGRVMLHHLSECQSDECVVPDCRRRRQGHPASRLLELERAHFEREVSYEAVKKKCMDCTRSYSGTRNLMPPPPIPLRQQPHRAVKRVMSDGDAHQSAVGRTVPQRVMSLPSNVVQEGRSRPQLMLDNTQAPSRQVPNASNVYMEQHSTPSTSNWSESPGPSSQTRGYYQSAGPTSPTLPPNVRIVKRTRPPDEGGRGPGF